MLPGRALFHKCFGNSEYFKHINVGMEVLRGRRYCKEVVLWQRGGMRTPLTTRSRMGLGRGMRAPLTNLSAEAINLLPYVHNRSLDHQDQQYIVSHFLDWLRLPALLLSKQARGLE